MGPLDSFISTQIEIWYVSRSPTYLQLQHVDNWLDDEIPIVDKRLFKGTNRALSRPQSRCAWTLFFGSSRRKLVA
jgi:hypothetical protein